MATDKRRAFEGDGETMAGLHGHSSDPEVCRPECRPGGHRGGAMPCRRTDAEPTLLTVPSVSLLVARPFYGELPEINTRSY